MEIIQLDEHGAPTALPGYGQPPFGDIRDLLLDLPHHHGGNGYVRADLFPVRYEIARLMRPSSIFEFGALTGYALVTMLRGSIDGGGRVDWVGWVDNESHTAGSNAKTVGNLTVADDQPHRANLWWGRDAADSLEAGHYELVAVDADHSYDETIRDTLWALQLSPQVLLFDDTHAHDGAGRAADDIARWLRVPSFYLPTVNGLTVVEIDTVHDLRARLEQAGYETRDSRSDA